MKPLKNAVNSRIRHSIFPNNAKRAVVTPLDKATKDKNSVNNYRPVSVLNFFSKFYEKTIKEQIMSFINSKLSVFLSAYRKNYSTQHVLLRLIEEWKKKLDKNYVVGAILIDLSKAFDCVPHDLVIAKLHAYGFDLKSMEYILSYLTNREQSTRFNEIYSLFEIILSGVPQGSILGPIIFNIFLNDLFFFIENNGIHNYTDDNTLSSFSNSFPNLITILENQSNIPLSWLQNNKMIANPKKLYAILLSKIKSDNSDFEIKIGNRTIRSERTVKLLGVTLDDKLNFDLHVSKICKTASTQLNALYRFKSILHLQAKRVLVQSFVYANFNYCPLVWHFSSAKSLLKVEKIHERAVRFLYNSDKISCDNLSVKSPSNNDMCVLRLRNLCREN